MINIPDYETKIMNAYVQVSNFTKPSESCNSKQATFGFFISSLFSTLRSMTTNHYDHQCPTIETFHNLVINPATCTSNCHSTSCCHHNVSSWKPCQSISANLWGTWLNNFCVLSMPRFRINQGVVRTHFGTSGRDTFCANKVERNDTDFSNMSF